MVQLKIGVLGVGLIAVAGYLAYKQFTSKAKDSNKQETAKTQVNDNIFECNNVNPFGVSSPFSTDNSGIADFGSNDFNSNSFSDDTGFRGGFDTSVFDTQNDDNATCNWEDDSSRDFSSNIFVDDTEFKWSDDSLTDIDSDDAVDDVFSEWDDNSSTDNVFDELNSMPFSDDEGFDVFEDSEFITDNTGLDDGDNVYWGIEEPRTDDVVGASAIEAIRANLHSLWNMPLVKTVRSKALTAAEEAAGVLYTKLSEYNKQNNG